MSIDVVCGVNWGDEGKGRMVDYLAQSADAVVRFQGGNNAGHTVINERGKFVLHLIPSGVLNPRAVNVLGPGTVVDLEGFDREITGLEAAGIDCTNVLISDRATLTLSFHRDEDAAEEGRLGAHAFGSTRQGIAPSYGDRAMKKGIRVGDLHYPDYFRDRLRRLYDWKQMIFRGVYGRDLEIDFDHLLERCLAYGEEYRDIICDTSVVLQRMASEGKTIFLEAQLGALRDVYFGIYPYTTSSCTLASFAPIGAGLFNKPVTRVIGVVKAFATCVGEGPFVTTMDEGEARDLRESAMEYGATTGRPRRIGHFDAVASRFGVELQGATEVALTKLDSLSGRDKLLLCTEYDVGGKKTSRFPLTPALDVAKPVYREMPGWSDDISGCRAFDDLPTAARNYVLAIEQLIGCRVRWVSVGARREEIIERT